jgi:ubiquitin thioesterase OTU1
MTPSALARRHVAADNNCLFTTCAYLCEGLTSEFDLRAAARRLRSVCGEAVLADPDPATRALLLGHDTVLSYDAWIRVESHWGGEPEVLMLAEHFGVEIVLTSCETLRSSTYAAAGGASTRIFILYTGQHYDPLVGVGGEGEHRKLPMDAPMGSLSASAVEIAKEHNAEAERRRKQRRVKRLRCGGCGAIVADNPAFQVHCGEVEHADDFTYECEQVEVVLEEEDQLPEGNVDLEAPSVHSFYNTCGEGELSLSMRCTLAPFELGGPRYDTLEDCIMADAIIDLPIADRRAAVMDAVRAQYGSDAAASSGLRAHLLGTGDKMLACIDLNPFLGIQAAGGISTGENHLGKALMAVRGEMGAEE